MFDKEAADIAAKIVITAIQNGGLIAGKAKTVCEYYAEIYSQIVSCDDNLSETRKNASASAILP